MYVKHLWELWKAIKCCIIITTTTNNNNNNNNNSYMMYVYQIVGQNYGIFNKNYERVNHKLVTIVTYWVNNTWISEAFYLISQSYKAKSPNIDLLNQNYKIDKK